MLATRKLTLTVNFKVKKGIGKVNVYIDSRVGDNMIRGQPFLKIMKDWNICRGSIAILEGT